MRAQRAYNEFSFARDSRSAIRKTNIIVPEPMPGEKDLLQEFTATLQPPLLGQLVEVIFDKMQLAGEAGSLLKIEEELRDAIAKAREQWARGPQEEQMTLFAENLPKAKQLRFDLSGITDDQFWRKAESRTIAALRGFAEAKANGTAFRRSLFADDAARGLALIDLCRRSYDTVLMNPPFGDAARPSKPYLDAQYPRTRNDMYAAFVERGLGVLHPGGMLGAITSRTGFFLTSFRKWREEILFKEARPAVMADLGYGVLDAMVETAAYCLVHAG